MSALIIIACIVVVLSFVQLVPLLLKALNSIIIRLTKAQKSAKMIKSEQKRKAQKERELRAQSKDYKPQSPLCEFSNGAQLLEVTNNNELSTLKIRLSNGKVVFIQKDTQGQMYIRANEPFCVNKGYMLLKEGLELGAFLKG